MKKRIEFYTDQELDSENGLYNYNARLYDPFIGRFISPDIIVPQPYNPQSLNRYSYCLNNPLIYNDPSGHAQMTFEEWQAYLAMGEYINSLYEVWPQMGGSLAHEMGFMDPVTPVVDLWNMGFEQYNAIQPWMLADSAARDVNIEVTAGGTGKTPTAKKGLPDVVGNPDLDAIAKKTLLSWPKKENIERGSVILENAKGYYVHKTVSKGKPYTNKVGITCSGCKVSQVRAVIHTHPWYTPADYALEVGLPLDSNDRNDKPGDDDHKCIAKYGVPNYVRSPDGTKVYAYERINGKYKYRTVK